ncbi:MAG: hypothetical protein QG621_357 [Patescibacteria group bacterium]|nr:hypothetical protein [Patescibacteria group bacterium]
MVQIETFQVGDLVTWRDDLKPFEKDIIRSFPGVHFEVFRTFDMTGTCASCGRKLYPDDGSEMCSVSYDSEYGPTNCRGWTYPQIVNLRGLDGRLVIHVDPVTNKETMRTVNGYYLRAIRGFI